MKATQKYYRLVDFEVTQEESDVLNATGKVVAKGGTPPSRLQFFGA